MQDRNAHSGTHRGARSRERAKSSPRVPGYCAGSDAIDRRHDATAQFDTRPDASHDHDCGTIGDPSMVIHRRLGDEHVADADTASHMNK